MQLFDGNLHMISCQCLVEQVAFVFQMAHYSAYLAAETVRRQSGEWLELRRQCQEKVLPTKQAASACEHVVGSLANMFMPCLCVQVPFHTPDRRKRKRRAQSQPN